MCGSAASQRAKEHIFSEKTPDRVAGACVFLCLPYDMTVADIGLLSSTSTTTHTSLATAATALTPLDIQFYHERELRSTKFTVKADGP